MLEDKRLSQIIYHLKAFLFPVTYKNRLLEKLLVETDCKRTVSEILKSFNVKNAIDLVVNCWNSIAPETILNCWEKLLANWKIYKQAKSKIKENSLMSEEKTTFLLNKLMSLTNPEQKITQKEAKEWLNNPEESTSSKVFTDDELVNFINKGHVPDTFEDTADSSIDSTDNENSAPNVPINNLQSSERCALQIVSKTIDQLKAALLNVNDTSKVRDLDEWSQEYTTKIIKLL